MSYVPHVVAWNLTRRCNLECAHCYISAGPAERATAELDTATCRRIVDDLLAENPGPLLILSGGEPLLREDLTEIARYASECGATVVVGTNGTLLTVVLYAFESELEIPAGRDIGQLALQSNGTWASIFLGSARSCRAPARTTVSSAYAHMAKVICRYHLVQLRTS